MTSPSLLAVIERVRKLRALSSSDNPHEAARATAIADRLIQEYRLEEAMLEAPAEIRGDGDPLVTWKTRAVHWQRVLAGVVSEHYDVAVVEVSGKHGVKVLMVGTREDMLLARELFAWVRSEIERLSVIPGQKRMRYAGKELNAFRLGCVEGVHTELERMKRSLRDEHPAGALVLASRRTRAIELLRQVPGTHTVSLARTVPQGAYEHGLVVGGGIDVARDRTRRLGAEGESEEACSGK